MKIPRRVRTALRRFCHMLGHKPVSVMKVIMKAGGAPAEELVSLKYFRCHQCDDVAPACQDASGGSTGAILLQPQGDCRCLRAARLHKDHVQRAVHGVHRLQGQICIGMVIMGTCPKAILVLSWCSQQGHLRTRFDRQRKASASSRSQSSRADWTWRAARRNSEGELQPRVPRHGGDQRGHGQEGSGSL